MPSYDFSTSLTHLNGGKLSGFSSGLPQEIFRDLESYKKQLDIANLLEPVLLYTVDRKDGQTVDDPQRFLTKEEKTDRFALTLKIRDGGVVEITDRDITTIKTAITVLPTEPYGIMCKFLEKPIE